MFGVRNKGVSREGSRLRRFSKWTGAALSLMLLLLWGGTALWEGWFVIHGYTVMYRRGCVVAYWGRNTLDQQWDFHARRRWDALVIEWKPRWRTYPFAAGPVRVAVVVPLWIPFLAIALPTYILWRRDRRHPPGHCQECGYDLTGNVTGVCSECGVRIDSL